MAFPFSGAGDAISMIPGGGTVGRVLGISDTKADNLSEDAKKAMAQSNVNAQNAYNLALAQAQAAGAIQAPSMIGATSVGVPTINAATVDTNNILDVTSPIVQAYRATAEKYDPALAKAISATSNMAGYDAALAAARSAATDMVSYAPERARVALAGPAQAASIGDVNTNVAAPEIAPAEQSQLVDVGRTNVSQLGTDARGESLNAARAIMDAKSSAASQFASSFDKATNDALSVAAQARGDERAGARREAIVQMALKGAAGAEGAAATAAQEDAAKRIAYANALQGVRGADVSVAQTQAQIDAQRSQLQAQLQAAIEQGNTAAVNAIRSQSANLEADAAKASVSAALQQQATQAGLSAQNAREQNAVNMANAQLGTSVNVSNAAAGTKAAADLAAARNLASQQYAEAATGVSQTNAANTTKAAADLAAARNAAAQQFATAATNVNQTNAAAQSKAAADYASAANEMATQYAASQTKASETNASLAAQRAEGNAQRATTAATSDAQNKTTAAIAQGTAALQAGTANASNALDANKANINSYLDTQKLQQSGTTAAIGAMNTAAGVQGSNAGAIVGAQKSEAEAQAKQDAALIGAAGSIGSMAMSDERTKTAISKPSDAAVDDLAEKISAYTWRYKPGNEDSGQYEHGGFMAQDVEKSPLGRKFVHEDEDGRKHVDVLSIAGLLAAAAARSMRKSKENRT